MSDPRPKLQQKQKIGLSLQVIGIVLLVLNIYSTVKTGESAFYIIPIGLFLVIGGMIMVLKKKK